MNTPMLPSWRGWVQRGKAYPGPASQRRSMVSHRCYYLSDRNQGRTYNAEPGRLDSRPSTHLAWPSPPGEDLKEPPR